MVEYSNIQFFGITFVVNPYFVHCAYYVLLKMKKQGYETAYDEYLRLYRERYGDSGPSWSSSCNGKGGDDCGCWTCHLQELRKGE